MPDINSFDSDQEITVDFEVDEVLDIQLGMVYQGEPKSGGLTPTKFVIYSGTYTIKS